MRDCVLKSLARLIGAKRRFLVQLGCQMAFLMEHLLGLIYACICTEVHSLALSLLQLKVVSLFYLHFPTRLSGNIPLFPMSLYPAYMQTFIHSFILSLFPTSRGRPTLCHSSCCGFPMSPLAGRRKERTL